MNATESSAAMIADLFDLDATVGPLHELPGGADSADCTNDGCTASCAGCRDDG